VNDWPKADPTSLDSVLAGVLQGSWLGVLLLTSEARLCWTNPAAARLLGGWAEALPGLALRHFFAEDEAQQPALARLEACIAANEPLQPGFELRLRDDARWLRLELQPLPPEARAAHGLGAALALFDVTEQRHSREEAGREGQLLREAARLGHIGAWDYDFVAQRLRWSEETFAIHDLPAGEPPTPEGALAYYDEASRPRVREAMRQALQEGKAFDLPLGLVTATGQPKRVRLIGSAQRGGEGGGERVVRVAGLFHDITEREHHAQALLDKAAAERASRAKSEFLSRVSHELRTPLNGVLGFSQLLLQRAIELPPWTAEPLRLIQRAGDHLLTLIDDMLDLGSIESGAPRMDMQAVALDAVVSETLRLVAPQALAAGVVLRSWTPSQAWVHADPMRLRQVLLNLLSNAIKYNRRDGEVRVLLQHEATALVLRVIDSGPGLSTAQRLELFQPFNRLGADATGVPGSGLGLTIARHLAEAMGGRLELAPPAAAGGTEAGRGSVGGVRCQRGGVGRGADPPAAPGRGHRGHGGRAAQLPRAVHRGPPGERDAGARGAVDAAAAPPSAPGRQRRAGPGDGGRGAARYRAAGPEPARRRWLRGAGAPARRPGDRAAALRRRVRRRHARGSGACARRGLRRLLDQAACDAGPGRAHRVAGGRPPRGDQRTAFGLRSRLGSGLEPGSGLRPHPHRRGACSPAGGAGRRWPVGIIAA
jgi:signal transduction histidine kinase